MQNVSRFEANLLRLLYYFLAREPVERVQSVLENRCEPPVCLSRGAVRLIQETLAKGTAYLLAQRGGWRDERHLRGFRVVSGRLWERTEPAQLGLSFSQHTLRFLLWITSARPGDKSPTWQPEHGKLTLGDLVLLYFAHQGLRDPKLESLGVAALRVREPFSSHGLCWLAFPEDFVQVPADVQPDFTPWMTGVGACVLEALQPDLEARWIFVESCKERIEQPATMRALGTAQERVLTAFLNAAEKAQRRDLARFLLRACHQLLGEAANPSMWTGALQTAGQRLTDRSATYQAATALLRQFERLGAWAAWGKSVWRFDDEYPAAQLYLSDWETYHGDVLLHRAQKIVRSLDPMRQV